MSHSIRLTFSSYSEFNVHDTVKEIYWLMWTPNMNFSWKVSQTCSGKKNCRNSHILCCMLIEKMADIIWNISKKKLKCLHVNLKKTVYNSSLFYGACDKWHNCINLRALNLYIMQSSLNTTDLAEHVWAKWSDNFDTISAMSLY